MAKIVFFNGTLCEGGAERVISLLSKELVDKGHNVEIVLHRNSPIFYEIDPHIKVTKIEKEIGTRGIIKSILWMRKYFKNNADIIVSFLAPFNMLAIMATIFSKVPLIVADRNDPKKVPQNYMIRKIRDILYCFADGVVLQTNSNKEYFNYIVKKKSVIIPNPIDLGDKKGLSLKSNKVKEIVSVGRLMPQKNQILLIKAFEEIHNEYPDYILTIYGEGPMRKVLTEEIEQLKLEKYVRLPGSMKDVIDRIASAELFILTSDYEGMPNALIEAMCLGLPVISTSVSGATDLIDSGENGILIDLNNKNDLVRAMRDLITNDKLRIKLGHNAEKIAEKLILENIVDMWFQFMYITMKRKEIKK